MCEKYERVFRGVTKDYFQWCILWLPFDKVRPGIIISNNWFIKTQKTILAVPLTSRDKSNELYPEFDDNYIPIINLGKKLNYTKITDMKTFNIDDLNPKSNKFIGVLTDEIAKQRICEIVSNITNPMYKAERLTYEYQKDMEDFESKVDIPVKVPEATHLTHTMNIPETTNDDSKIFVSKVVEQEKIKKEVVKPTKKEVTKPAKSKPGKKSIPFPDNWKEVYDKLVNKTINVSKACNELGLSSSTFYRLRKKYESELQKSEDTFITKPKTISLSYPFPLSDLTNLYNHIDDKNIKEIMNIVSKLPIFGNELIVGDLDDNYIIEALVLAISKKPSDLSQNKHKIFNNCRNMERWINILINYCYSHNLITVNLYTELNQFVKEKYKFNSKKNFFEK